MKDNFSVQSKSYARFRPSYPTALFDFIFSLVKEKNHALDCGTGNGQVAEQLAKKFTDVKAIDISEKQIGESVKMSNIHYEVSRAEKTPFKNNSFDLVTVGQAAHWFDLPEFYAEMNRVMKPGGVMALFGYGLPKVNTTVDSLLFDFYENTLGEYWDPERKLVDQHYRDLYFPYEKIPNNGFNTICNWDREHFCGFLDSWSAVQHYRNRTKRDPLAAFEKLLGETWPAGLVLELVFPVFLIAARLKETKP